MVKQYSAMMQWSVNALCTVASGAEIAKLFANYALFASHGTMSFLFLRWSDSKRCILD